MKSFTKVFFLLLILISVNISAQECNGNTFNSPGAPATCTYNYTASGWEDQFGNPITAPSSINVGESVCFLTDNSTNFGQIKGLFHVAMGVTYSGSVTSFSDATTIIQGTANFANSPSIDSGNSLYIESTGIFNTPGNYSPGGLSITENAGQLLIGGDLLLGGTTSINNYTDGTVIIQGNATISNGFNNCGLFEVVTGNLVAGGGSNLTNLCTVYVHNDMTLSADYLNDELLIIDGSLIFNGQTLTNNGVILISDLILNNDDLVGNNETSVLIVRNNAELQSASSITGHFYFDVDDGGGFDTVCGTCIEEINILPDVTIPSVPADLKADCGDNIIYHLCTDTTGTDSDGDGVYDICDLDDDNDGILDTDELGTIISTEQQPCGGDTPLNFSNTPTLISGTDLLQGAVYRFPNISTGMDAIITIVETNNATVVDVDRNVTTPESFKPRTGFNFTNIGERGYIEYLIQFVNSGGTTPQIIPKFFMNFNDLDGGPNFGEQNWADNPSTYTIDNPTEVTMNTDGTWIVATGATSDYGPSTNEFPYINFAVNYTNKSEIKIRVGAVARVPGASSVARSHSIEFNCVTNYVAPETYSLDADFDGIANHLDLDSDNDGILDAVEAGHNQTHINGVVSGSYGTNGLADNVETSPGSSIINYTITDTDGQDGSNYLDLDSDNDDCYDALEGTAGYDFNNVNILTGQLTSSIDANGIPGGTSQGVGTSIDGSTQAAVCLSNDNSTIDFDGIDDYVEVANSAIDGLNEYTISCWFKYEGPAITSSAGEVFLMGQKDLFEITISDWGTSDPDFEDIGAKIFKSSGIPLRSGKRFDPTNWTHITVTVSFDGTDTEFKVFRNGWASSSGTVLGTINTNSNPFRIGIANETTSYANFEGAVDEVRIFNKVLTDEQIQRMVYQEIKNESGKVRGTIINKDIKDEGSNEFINWTDVISYYPMNNIKNGKLPDASSYNNEAVLYNITTFQPQTAPMPYETVADGDWLDESTWLHGGVWDIDGLEAYFGDSDQNPEPWSIVKIHHNVSTNSNRRNLGLFIDDSKTLTVNGDNSVTNSWYLELNGTLDLQDDSQLVQGIRSDLVTSANGKILRRQEGNVNKYWYNYWSSPVGSTTTTTLSDNNSASNNPNNTPFSLNMLKDGNGDPLTFSSNWNNNVEGVTSTYWLYTFQNGLTYNDWVSIGETTAIQTGFGYTQKGTGNTVDAQQQYIFEGKPNNGTILIDADDVDGDSANESEQNVTLTTTLIGNPYPSALDARQFINDNLTVIDGNPPAMQGTILLWEQWAGNSHYLSEYQGGYGYINLTSTARAYQHADITIAGQTQTEGIKRPTYYIPVSQGFFVEVINDGDIEFNNGQRVFIKESDVLLDQEDNDYANNGSSFFRTSSTETSSNTEATVAENPLQLIRFEFETSQGSTRRFVLGFGDNATDGLDYGLDGGLIIDKPEDDMGSLLNGEQYVIQALAPITPEKVVDLTLNASGNYTYSLKIVEFQNIAEDQEIYLKDNLTNTYFDLRNEQAYNFTSVAGEFSDRFDIVFQSGETLSNEEFTNDNTLIYVNNIEDMLYVKGLSNQAKQLNITNMLGQTIKTYANITTQQLQNGINISSLSTGVYVVSVQTENNLTIDKKIIIN